MDFLVKITSFRLVADLYPEKKNKLVFLGTFEHFDSYGWFMEGKNKELLKELLCDPQAYAKIQGAFPYIPLNSKRISLKHLDYEIWFPIFRRKTKHQGEKCLGWSRTNDLGFDLTEEQILELKVGRPAIFTVLWYYEDDETSKKWLNTKKLTEKKQ